MSNHPVTLPVAKGQNLPWILIPILVILGFSSMLQATLLFSPGLEQSPVEATQALQPKAQKPKTIPESVVPVAVVVAQKASVECVPVFSVLFGHGKAEVAAPKIQCRRLVDWLNLHPRADLVIRGYADSTGSAFANMEISHRRAEFVKSILVDAGLQNGNISVQAFGEYSQLAGINQASSNQRRVTLTVPGFPDCRTKDQP